MVNLGVRSVVLLGDVPMFQPSLVSEIVSLRELGYAGFDLAFRANGLCVAIGNSRILHLVQDFGYQVTLPGEWIIVSEISLLLPEIDS